MTTPKPIPNNLREYRSRAGMLQIDVARALGLTSSDRISHWEKGQMVPSLVNLFKLSVLFSIPPQELYRDCFDAIKETIQANDLTTETSEMHPPKALPVGEFHS